MRRLLVPSIAPLLFALTAACSDEVIHSVPSGSGGSGTGGSTSTGSASGGEGGMVPVEPAIEQVRAPDQTSIEVSYNTDVAALVPTTVESFVVSSDEVEPLTVESVTYNAVAHVLVLGTARQKLGATYRLTIAGATEPLAGGEFLAADTARFWATDFADFQDYELVADRIAVGEHAVVYIEQGQSTSGAAGAVTHFDEEIFPKETALLSEPSDVDDNGRIVLLGLDGSDHYGGYFSPVNNLPDDETFPQWGYHSNETDMVYINVIYGFEETHVLPHEFSHLLYHQQHGWQWEDWSWHNEGLAECAVQVVNGENGYAVDTVFTDPFGDIAKGLSLVHWQYGNYNQYALAFMFWSYLAAQAAGGPEAYGELFNLSGAPADIDAWVQSKLGKTFAEAQRDFMLAMWVQAPTGAHGFAGMIDLPGSKPPVVPAGTSSLDLEPYAGAFFKLFVDSVDYPGTQGTHILYSGVDSAAAVDLEAPFAITGGALVVLNTNPDAEQPTKEKSGPDLAALSPPMPKASKLTGRSRAWLHPPPLDPRNMDRLHAWRARTAGF